MKINNLQLINYRNYNNEKILFKDNINFLVGKNAQGKTNVIEAIYFSAIGKSSRTNKENELINYNKENAKIVVNLEKKDGTSKIECYLSKKSKKSIKINEVNILKISQLIGTLNCVYFSPDELKLVKDSASDRRKFMDIDISQISKNYFYAINKYNKVLAQRNKLLKTTKDLEVLKETITIWDESLAKIGAGVIIRRIRFLNKLKKYTKDVHLKLTKNKENLELFYSGIIKDSAEEIEKEFLKELNKRLEKDFKLGFTSFGPHRDDIKFLVNGIDIRSFGSQGQQRTVALTLKIAELEIFKEEIGEYPILLLDDVLSELDSERKLLLLDTVKNVQTIITDTNLNIDKKYNIIKIENGAVV